MSEKVVHAIVEPTGLDFEPTGTVEISIEALRSLCEAAHWRLVEHEPGTGR